MIIAVSLHQSYTRHRIHLLRRQVSPLRLRPRIVCCTVISTKQPSSSSATFCLVFCPGLQAPKKWDRLWLNCYWCWYLPSESILFRGGCLASQPVRTNGGAQPGCKRTILRFANSQSSFGQKFSSILCRTVWDSIVRSLYARLHWRPFRSTGSKIKFERSQSLWRGRWSAWLGFHLL